MPTIYFIESPIFNIADDIKKMRDHPAYLRIRHAIEQRFQPLSGGIDWLIVYKACQELIVSDGIDLQVAIYFTIAAFKIEGLTGLANGLEMQAVLLHHSKTVDLLEPITAKRTKGLYRWMNERILKEINQLSPKIDQLRELYRCERTLEIMNQALQDIPSEWQPDLESLAFIIFEKIDHLELSFKTSTTIAITAPPPHKTTYKSQKYIYISGIIMMALMIIALLYWYNNWDQARQQPFTTRVWQPRLIELSQLSTMVLQMPASQLQQQHAKIIDIYGQTIEKTLHTSLGEYLNQTLQLGHQLNILFPNDVVNQTLQHQLKQRMTMRDDIYQKQLSRFLQARTLVANLQHNVMYNESQQLQQVINNLANYAISLSPLFGRIIYIESLLQQREFSQAQQELDNLELILEAVALKQQRLQQQLL